MRQTIATVMSTARADTVTAAFHDLEEARRVAGAQSKEAV